MHIQKRGFRSRLSSCPVKHDTEKKNANLTKTLGECVAMQIGNIENRSVAFTRGCTR